MVEFKLPTVIVVGGRSAGKSSLLENITKCPVFPRDPALCTKMPVKLRLIQVAKESESSVTIDWRGNSVSLRSKDDILQAVADIMDAVDGIVTDELTVTICQVDVPTFELIDLPGLQAFPEEQQRCTQALVSKYLNKPDTLVLCVVDATIPSLDSSTALGMVRAANKLPNTILALTKSDLVRSEVEITERIFDRVLGTSSEHQHLAGLAGCVAVANRNHTDHLSLVDADVEEQCCFKAMLVDPAPLYAPAELQRQLRDNMTIKRLILKLDSLFHNFIVARWKPAALAFLAPLKDQAQDEIQRLGPSVEALSKDGVMDTILTKVDYDLLCEALQSTNIQITKASQLFTLASHLTYHPWGTLAWAEAMTKVEQKVTKAVLAALAGDKYDRPVLDAFNAVFEKSTLTPLKLKRFGSLKALLLSELLPARVAEAKKEAKPAVLDMLQKAMLQLNVDCAPGTATFQLLDIGIRGCIIKHMIAQIKNRPMSLPESFQLVEDDKVRKKRGRLTDKLNQVVSAADRIAHIEEAISVGSDTDFNPDSPPAQDIPDCSEFEQHYQQAADASATEEPTAAAAAAAMADELQMQAVPEQSLHSSHHSGEPVTPTASSHSTTVPISVAAQVTDAGGVALHAASGPSSPPATALSAPPAVVAAEEEVPTSNLACSMVQLGSMHFDPPASAAGMEAETETVPWSPTVSVAPSIAESFFHVEALSGTD
ncbi:hypothetical protein ABBQ38_012088 [Trebouxia sp. C0009 RCD-2024]